MKLVLRHDSHLCTIKSSGIYNFITKPSVFSPLLILPYALLYLHFYFLQLSSMHRLRPVVNICHLLRIRETYIPVPRWRGRTFPPMPVS